MKRVLFICTHNSARSQMAEGLLRALRPDAYEVASAGIEARGVHPLAIKAMAEIGIDISSHRSKVMDPYIGMPWDHVVTVCDGANEACPFFPGGAVRLHRSFQDPSRAEGTETERMEAWRRVRDQIKDWIEEVF